MPVVDGGAVVGIVSEGDLLRRGETRTERRRPGWLEMLLNRDIQAAGFVKEHGTCARDVMTADVIAVAPDTDFAEIARILERRRIKRVPVIDKGRLVGIVSRANLLRGLVAYRHSPAGLDAKSDPDLAHAVEERLSREVWVDLRRMNIVVTDGVVHLWGAIDWRSGVGRWRWRPRRSPASSASRITSRPTGSRTRPAELSLAWSVTTFCYPSAAVESAQARLVPADRLLEGCPAGGLDDPVDEAVIVRLAALGRCRPGRIFRGSAVARRLP